MTYSMSHPSRAWRLLKLLSCPHPHRPVYDIAAGTNFRAPLPWSVVSDTVRLPAHICPYTACLLDINVSHRPHKAWLLDHLSCPFHITPCPAPLPWGVVFDTVCLPTDTYTASLLDINVSPRPHTAWLLDLLPCPAIIYTYISFLLELPSRLAPPP